MTMNTWVTVLTYASMALGGVVALVVAVTAVQTALGLARVKRAADQLALVLEAAAVNTAGLPEQIPAIATGLTMVEERLGSADVHLLGTARAYGMVN